MKKRKFVSIALSLSMLASAITTSVAAASFSDVDGDSTVSWAKQSIEKMTDAGYIKGYEDGTFRPYNAITKIESLILMSRMLGFEDSTYSKAVSDAVSLYKSTVTKYNSTYPNELSYLMYCGVLTESDLADYASSANANVQLYRYQAAMLMSKLMGADAKAKSYSVSTPTYADNIAIPQPARPYVEYVTANGIMNGMDATEDEQPQFSPLTTLTRAQMATLLARVMDKISLDYVSGEVTSINNSSVSIDGSKINFASSYVTYVDGAKGKISDISEGSDASVIVVSDNAMVISGKSAPKETTTLYGIVKLRNESSSGRKIKIADYENQDDTAEYWLSDDCTVYINDSKANFSELRVGDFVKVVLTGSEVTEVSTEDSEASLKGTLISTSYDDNYVYFEVEDSNGVTNKYVESTKGATIVRDSDTATVRDLAAGDTVTLKLVYGKVAKVTAVSKSETFSGLLTEIVLSSEPKVTITSNGVSNTYKLRSNATITVAGVTTDIYSLRPNVTVTGKLDSNEVKSITAATTLIDEKGEFTGTVTGKNTTYKVINIKDEQGNIQSVYYNNNTNFLTSSGSNTNVKAIETDAKISVTGSYKNGVFEATIVIVK